jgi:hypothetical protein
MMELRRQVKIDRKVAKEDADYFCPRGHDEDKTKKDF